MRSKQIRTSKLDWPIVVHWGFCLSTTYIAKVRISSIFSATGKNQCVL